MLKKEITIYDLADKLSLSIAIVSRALNNHPVVKKNTKKTVLIAAKEPGYRRNGICRATRGSRM
jgi:LacI family transcriptional regulator